MCIRDSLIMGASAGSNLGQMGDTDYLAVLLAHLLHAQLDKAACLRREDRHAAQSTEQLQTVYRLSLIHI